MPMYSRYLVITKDPRNGKRNVGMYRMQVYDATSTGMHWQRHKVGAEHYRNAMRAAQSPDAGRQSSVVDVMARTSGGARAGGAPKGKLEVAVAIGTDPATTFCAIVPAPPDIDEFMISGFLRQKPVEMVKCETVDLEVPAHS